MKKPNKACVNAIGCVSASCVGCALKASTLDALNLEDRIARLETVGATNRQLLKGEKHARIS